MPKNARPANPSAVVTLGAFYLSRELEVAAVKVSDVMVINKADFVCPCLRLIPWPRGQRYHGDAYAATLVTPLHIGIAHAMQLYVI